MRFVNLIGCFNFFADLVAILVLGAWGRWLIVASLLVFLMIILKLWFTKEEIFSWLASTGQFVRLILPWLLVGVFAAGLIKAVLPPPGNPNLGRRQYPEI